MNATQPMFDDAAAARTAELAQLAFGSRASGELAHTGGPRHLAFLPPDALELDLTDPQQCDFGDYVLVEKLGQGGMGIVYRAHQRSLDRDVALKLLTAGPWASKDFIERFRREAQSAALLQHPNIVAVHEIGSREDLHFFSMRLVRGTSLARRVAERGALAPVEAAKLVRTIAEALDYAHRMGVLHLDLKPGNVLIEESGEVLVADFGLARRLDATLAADADEVSGTPSYMAPEQAQIRTHRLSPATDIYGLGAILYDLVTGRPPFLAGTPAETLRRVVQEAPEPPSAQRNGVPRDLDAICLKCLAKDPKDRYATARELADDLGRFAEGRPVSVRTPTLLERARLFAKREPRLARWIVAEGCAVILAFVALVYGMYFFQELSRSEAAQRAAAEQQRDLAERNAERREQATQLMAAMFPEDDVAVEKQSRAAMAWFEANLQDDDARAELLGALTEALIAAKRTTAATTIALDIQTQLGRSYRMKVVDALVARGGADDIAHAALVAQSLYPGAAAPGADELLRRAWTASPDDPWIGHLAAMHCRYRSLCAVPEASDRLMELEPDNAAPWLYALGFSPTRIPTQTHLREMLARAARATHYQDYYGRYVQERVLAMRSSGVPMPDVLSAPPSMRFFKGSGISPSAYLAVWDFPLPRMQRVLDMCDPNRADLSEPGLREDCIAVGRLLADARGSVHVNLAGWAMLRRLLYGTDVEIEMIIRRTRYAWMSEQDATIAQVRQPPEEFVRNLVEHGELEAFYRVLDRLGIPRKPPMDWVPKEPQLLLLPEARQPIPMPPGLVPCPPAGVAP